jgi:hypothetical protein
VLCLILFQVSLDSDSPAFRTLYVDIDLWRRNCASARSLGASDNTASASGMYYPVCFARCQTNARQFVYHRFEILCMDPHNHTYNDIKFSALSPHFRNQYMVDFAPLTSHEMDVMCSISCLLPCDPHVLKHDRVCRLSGESLGFSLTLYICLPYIYTS